MEEKKEKTWEEKKEDNLDYVIKKGYTKVDYLIAILTRSIDKLETTTKQGTEETNKLTGKIKALNVILIIIGALGVIIGGLTLAITFYRTFCMG